MSKRVKNRKGSKKPYIYRLKSEVLETMGFLRKRWREKSTRIQLVNLAAMLGGLVFGLDPNIILGAAGSFGLLGAVVPD